MKNHLTHWKLSSEKTKIFKVSEARGVKSQFKPSPLLLLISTEEISDLTDQLGEGGKSIHELEKAKRTLEHERNEIQAALEEAEGAIEGEEAKVLRLQVELAQMKQDFERRISEKEEELDNQRYNHLGISVQLYSRPILILRVATPHSYSPNYLNELVSHSTDL